MTIKSDEAIHEMPPPGPRALATMEKLVDAAEKLFAEQGVLGAAVRDITVMAGQRNASAMHYHFGGRAGLVAAVLARRGAQVAAERAGLMAALAGETHVASLMRGVVEPFANRLTDDSGCRYLLILEQCLTIPGLMPGKPGFDESMSVLQTQLAAALSWIPEHVLVRRLEFVIGALLGALAVRARARLQKLPMADGDAVYVDDLVEMLAAAISAPLPLLMG